MNAIYPDNERIIDCMAKRVAEVCGDNAWESIAKENAPTGNMDNRELSLCMEPLLQRLERTAGKDKTEHIMSHVRHGLVRKDYQWARDIFLNCNDIDTFAEMIWNQQMNQLEVCFRDNSMFYDQRIDKDAYEYARSVPELFYGRRYDNKIVAIAIPYRLIDYLSADDSVMKRYFMCHCQFARESIREEKTVSGSMCYCSMGHVKLFWETALDSELEGRVVESALYGDNRCVFEFYLPDSVAPARSRARKRN